MTKKGDIVAVAREHSATGVIGSGIGTTRSVSFSLAYAEQVGRDGTVRKVRFVGGDMPVQQVKNLFRASVKLISGPMQANARTLAASLAYGDNHWDTPEAIKAAIVGGAR